MAARRRITPAQPTAVELEQAIKNKFLRLAKIQTQLANVKSLYVEQDSLVEELMPMFIQRQPDGSFVIHPTVTIGQRAFRLNPTFYNSEKNKLVAKTWKSGATPTVHIET